MLMGSSTKGVASAAPTAAVSASAKPRDPPVVDRVLVLEAGRAERHYWRDSVALSRAVRHPCLARCCRALQADRHRRRLGGRAAVPDHGHLHHRVRPARQAAERRRRALSHLVFAGMLPWFLFSSILGEASSSLVGNANLVGKVYFPRIIIPASSAVVALVDFGINLALLFGLMIWYRISARLGASCFCRLSSSLPCWRAWGRRS